MKRQNPISPEQVKHHYGRSLFNIVQGEDLPHHPVPPCACGDEWRSDYWRGHIVNVAMRGWVSQCTNCGNTKIKQEKET